MRTRPQRKVFQKLPRVSRDPTRDWDLEAWEKTDRPLQFPQRDPTTETSPESAPPNSEGARIRWLQDNDVHTEFLDAGIGCCWFAYRGEKEPVSGESEDAAIERLARENGLELWRGATSG